MTINKDSSTILADNPLCNPYCHCCHYKRDTYSTQIMRKTTWAQTQLQSWQSVLFPIVTAPEQERLAYRTKSWMRSQYTEGGLSFGMFRSVQRESRWEKEFISWNTCPLQSKAIQFMVERLRLILAKRAPQFCKDSLMGLWAGRPHLVIVSKNVDTQNDLELLRGLPWKEILEPPFDQVWFHCNVQVGKRVFGHGPIALIAGTQSPGTAHPIRAFRQVAQTLLTQARQVVVTELLRSKPSLVLDLYSGTGDLSKMLPSHVGWVGIERSKYATAFAQTLREGVEGVTHLAFAGTVEQRLQDRNVIKNIVGPYAVFLNPPRPGLGEKGRAVLFSLLEQKPPAVVVYLSCSASSLARDLRGFGQLGYEVKLLQPYDFFPQTEHFETVAVLQKT